VEIRADPLLLYVFVTGNGSCINSQQTIEMKLSFIMGQHRAFARLSLLCSFSIAMPLSSAQTTQPPQKVPTVHQSIEVTATRLPEDPQDVPAAIEVFTGDELGAQGAQDLRSTLANAIGVEIAPGGDAGPASAVPDFWGLKEFDAFLLVVDGVPWGGAFNPSLTSLDLHDIERVEVLRGPAPVIYGATSFVGVIQVVHKNAAATDKTLDLHAGTHGSGGGSFSVPLPLPGNWASRITVDGERQGFSDPRTSYRRGHGLWRAAHKTTASNRVWFGADLNWLDQDPASPRPRAGTSLPPLIPVDANQNMAGAFLNDHRGTMMAGSDRSIGGAEWSLSASVSHDRQDAFRGFLNQIEEVPDNAHGFREKIHLTDVYVDSHVSWRLPRSVRFIVGGDYLHGPGTARGADFDYTAPLSGLQAAVVASPTDLDFHIDDSRNFFGGYTSAEWTPLERLRLDGGVRLNVTREHQQVVDGGAGTSEQETRTDVRPGASLGAMFTAWQQKQDSIGIYVNYRDTFKPAVIDFGIGESEGGDLILKPETSRSVEGGVKGRLIDRRLDVEASAFLMNFSNLVTAASVNGVPSLINAGSQRFSGFESGVALFPQKHVIARATYSFHDATFTNFVQDFDGVPVQLAGKHVEMSARNLAALGLAYSPARGFGGGIELSYTGSRYLDKQNTALAAGFASIGLNIAYRTPRWELRVDACNLSDHRDPVSESELGDSQYYLLPSRRVDVGFRLHF
jgi:iron complex outermembrane receptor protein